jgi:hypothetical protein
MCHGHVAAVYNCGGQHMTVVGVGIQPSRIYQNMCNLHN